MASPAWCIERQPHGVTDPMVVAFRKSNGRRTLLNQNARWAGNGWDPRRWQPTSPTVPADLLQRIERHMRALDPPQDLVQGFMPLDLIHRQSIDPPPTRRQRLHRTAPHHDPFT